MRKNAKNQKISSTKEKTCIFNHFTKFLDTIFTFGATASGKSTVLNNLAQTKNFPIKTDQTPKLNTFLKIYKNGQICNFIEIPDISLIINSLQKNHDKIIQEIREISIKNNVAFIIFCYPITFVRCDADTQKIIQFIKIFFKEKIPPIYLYFTFCNMLKEEELIKAKENIGSQIINLFEIEFKSKPIFVEFFNNLTKVDISTKFINSLIKIPKFISQIETIENLLKFIENERKESCEMLLQYAEIIEEEKKINEKNLPKIQEIDDLNSELPFETEVLIKKPNLTKPIRTKNSIISQNSGKMLYLQKVILEQKEKNEQKITRLSYPVILNKKL